MWLRALQARKWTTGSALSGWSVLDAEQAMLDERGSLKLRPRFGWKPNGVAISVQLHKCFAHVTRDGKLTPDRRTRQVASATWWTTRRVRPRPAKPIPVTVSVCHSRVADP